jgi:hypothetical protein
MSNSSTDDSSLGTCGVPGLKRGREDRRRTGRQSIAKGWFIPKAPVQTFARPLEAPPEQVMAAPADNVRQISDISLA